MDVPSTPTTSSSHEPLCNPTKDSQGLPGSFKHPGLKLAHVGDAEYMDTKRELAEGFKILYYNYDIGQPRKQTHWSVTLLGVSINFLSAFSLYLVLTVPLLPQQYVLGGGGCVVVLSLASGIARLF